MFEVIVKGGSKSFPTQAAADGFIGAVQALLGADAQIIVNQVAPAYDNNKAGAKVIGSVVTRIAEYPPKPEPPPPL